MSPHIESSSVFAGILDPEVGGQFAVQPTGEFESDQEYVERTNELETSLATESGTATLTDFMPIVGEQQTLDIAEHALYRRVECGEGSIEFDVEFAPRFDYARAETTVEAVDGGVLATGNDEELFCQSSVALDTDGSTATGTVTLDEGDTVWFVCQ
ncbi:trehalase-like domain-containing protein [Halococcus morrhuae DSM 1307]|uniref:trehalase-like domain-containing protein n=1 Tax=Halococcus morrhuae TaxID=2250 RepID=UPI000ABC7305|nr:trehalase-like domain-containing protein [Halococcus morrhuae]